MPRIATTEQKSIAAQQKERKDIEDYRDLVKLIELKVIQELSIGYLSDFWKDCRASIYT